MRINLYFTYVFMFILLLVSAENQLAIAQQTGEKPSTHSGNENSLQHDTTDAYSGSNLHIFNKKSNCLSNGEKSEKAVGFIHHDSYLESFYTDNLTVYNSKDQKFIYDQSLKDLISKEDNNLAKNETIFKVSRGKNSYQYLSYCGINGNLVHIGNNLWLNLDELNAKSIYLTSLASYVKDLGRFAMTKYPSILYLTSDNSTNKTVILPKGGNVEIIKDSCTDDEYCDIKFWKKDEYDPFCYITNTPTYIGRMQIIDKDFLPTVDEYNIFEGFCEFTANVDIVAKTNNRSSVTHKAGNIVYAYCNESMCYAVNKCTITPSADISARATSTLEYYKFNRVIDGKPTLQLIPGNKMHYDCLYDIDIR